MRAFPNMVEVDVETDIDLTPESAHHGFRGAALDIARKRYGSYATDASYAIMLKDERGDPAKKRYKVRIFFWILGDPDGYNDLAASAAGFRGSF